MSINSIMYNRVEIFLIISFLVMQAHGGIWPVALWTGLGLSAWWILMTSTQDAHDHAVELIKNKHLVIQDTLLGGLLLLWLAYIVRNEMWFFSVMFLLTAVQNFRYTYMIKSWVRSTR